MQLAEYEAAVKARKASGRSRLKAHGAGRPRRATRPGPRPEKPVKPRPVRIITGDATVEALAPILKQNPRGLLMHRDELSGWVRTMNMYRGGKGGDRQFYLSAWSGQDVVVDRKSEGTRSIFVPHPFLCILGSIQPDMLTELADAKGRQDGFIDRILFVFPETTAGQPWPDRPVPREVIGSWARVLRRLYRHEDEGEGRRDARPEGAPADPRGAGGLQGLVGRPAGRDAGPDVRPGAARRAVQQVPGPPGPAGAGDPLPATGLRRDRRAADVDAESARRAARLADYFKAHCIKVHGRLRVAVEDKQAEAVLGWIRRNGGRCTARDLCRNEVAGIKKSTEAKRMLKDLEDRGFGHCTVIYAGKKESVTFAVGEVVG